MQDKSIELFSLYDILVKTSYHTQITRPNDKNLENPVGFGSGFIVEFNNNNFFVTADHTLHLDDYDDENKERLETEYVISIFNNYNPPDNFPSTIFTPLGSFHYMDEINLDEPEMLFKPVDVCVCKVTHRPTASCLAI
ncbi:MAG TPA: hypothetical protein VNG53_01965 [Bacteroidia bacterium]|nr:hypothetical protein [Bacteroidia bacterium]